MLTSMMRSEILVLTAKLLPAIGVLNGFELE
jgi:hypothetical protein